jgi:hypothetical protein
LRAPNRAVEFIGFREQTIRSDDSAMKQVLDRLVSDWLPELLDIADVEHIP